MTEKKHGPDYFSLISLCLLFSGFIIFNYFMGRINLFFLTIQLLSVLWVNIFMSSIKFNLFAGIPLVIIAPFMILQLSTHNSLALYHMILGIFAMFFLLRCDIKLIERIIMYVLFLGSYLLSTYLHKSLTFLDMAVYGGVLLHFIIISLGITTHQRNENEKELDKMRAKLLSLKDGYKDKEQDPLMGIFSKSGGMKVLKQTMKWSQRYEIPLTVCYMELNNSRDDYIHSITRRIVNRVRESDTLFRLGKSEILLILPDCHKSDAVSVMKSIQDILQNDKEMDAVQFGLADFKSEHKTSPNELIINANMAIA